MLRQNLSQKQLQKLSPQQIQLMKLLQIPTATLDQRIQEELESNPALEEGEEYNEVFDLDEGNDDGNEEFELDDYLKDYIDDDPSYYKLKSSNYSSDDEERSMPMVVENTFHEHLIKQLGLQNITDEETLIIAMQVIGSIDHDGYLRRDTESIVDDLMFSQNIFTSQEQIEAMVEVIQTFDPAGVGAKDLKECLTIQIKQKIDKDPTDSKLIALQVLNKYFDEFSKKHYNKLIKGLDVSEEELKMALDEIIKLNPKPASGFASNNARGGNQYVLPDFIIKNRDGELDLSLNNKNAPDLRINDNYMDMLKGYQASTSGRRANKKEKEAVMFIKQKIDSAKWFIDAIRQRQDTLYRTMYSIMQYQYDFFTTGDEMTIKPMILKDIAEVTGLDISTVSRVANSKYVQTEFGTKLLKDFFSESMETKDGTEVSTLEVKNILKEVVSEENKKKPFSDEKLKDILQNKGYNIARRTVAKYREQLNIPVARLRKEL